MATPRLQPSGASRAATTARPGRPGECVAIARSAPGARRRRRAKSPPAPSAAVLEAPPRLLTQSGPLQLGAKAELQVQIAEERLLAEQEQRQRAEHGSAAPAERSTAARPVYPPTQSVSHIVPAPPKLGAATQQAEEKQQEQPATPQQHKREQPASPRGGGGPAARRQKPRSRRSGNTSRKSSRATIRPKEGDLVGWYQDATKAAEQAHRAAARGGGAAPSLAHALVKPLQGLLDERLEGMGFEPRAFPPLAPLGLPPAPAQAAGGGGAFGGGGEAPAPGAGSIIAHFFAELAQEAEGNLPILASQWHEAPPSLWDPRAAAALLQESHAAHAYCGAAEEHAQAMAALYEAFARDVAGLPVVAGRRSARGTLRGAAATYTVEALVGQGRALQVAAAHHLADNYSTVLGACYFDADGEEQCIAQMGAGLQASALSALALVHGDDAGLRLPADLAPVQVAIVPCWYGGAAAKAALLEEAERLRRVLAAAGIRATVDARRTRPGVRFGAADRAGVPLRLELGARDVAARTCTLVPRRLAPGAPGFASQPAERQAGVSTEGGDALVDAVRDLLDEAQGELRWGAAAALEESIVDVSSFLELREVVEAGKWARGPWAGSLADELAVAEETGASLRCFPLQQPTSLHRGFATCLYSGYQAHEVALFARPL